MKRNILFSVFAGIILFVFSGCEKLFDKVGVTINSDYTYIRFTVNPDKAGTFQETFKTVESDLDSLVDAEGQNIGEINSVIIKDARIEIVGEGNLDPFSSFVVTLEATGRSAITIAEINMVPTGINTLELINKEVDLTDYLKSDQYTIKVKTVLDQDLEVPVNMQARVRFEIKVGL